MNGIIFLVILAVLLLFFAKKAIKIVPQSEEWVVTRLGAQHKTLGAGIGFIIPFLDKIHSRISIADQVLDTVSLDVVSSDNVVFGVELLVVYRIDKPQEAVFRVNSISNLVLGLVKSLVRAEIGKYELDALQKDRENLNQAIRLALAKAGEDYGVIISRAEITDVQLQQSTQKAMAEVLEAERTRRATVTRAEGAKRAVELQSDANLYEETKRAEAIVAVARATATANALIGESIKVHGEPAARFQIAQNQIGAVLELSKSQNTKVVFMPGDTGDGMTRAAAMIVSGKDTDS
jgi:regulator of protease activity HflC (stomatin/prohibitin superfamily)